MSADRQATSIQRSLSLLAQLGGQANPHTLRYSSLRSALQCPDPSLARLLHSLCQLDLVEQDAGGYRLTKQARQLGLAISGAGNSVLPIRAILADLSEAWGCGTALFTTEPTGVRCYLRHQRPGAVAFIEEGTLRQDLHGHGCAVVACAWQPQARRAHARRLRADLGLSGPAWQELLQDIRSRGWYAPQGSESDGNHPQPTFIRLSLPVHTDGRLHAVLCGIAHGLQRKDVFPDSAITTGQAAAQRLAPLLNRDMHKL